jgi:hypothetical protein
VKSLPKILSYTHKLLPYAIVYNYDKYVVFITLHRQISRGGGGGGGYVNPGLLLLD